MEDLADLAKVISVRDRRAEPLAEGAGPVDFWGLEFRFRQQSSHQSLGTATGVIGTQDGTCKANEKSVAFWKSCSPHPLSSSDGARHSP
jgi:hypothetical protein